MKLKLFLFIFCALVNLKDVNGQNNNSGGKTFYNIPTPNASELMKVGNIPVNYHTGIADISIPLYSYNYEGVPLNILLKYDASGLPMNRLPGWTGQGWTLTAGGAITRNKIGYPDDMSFRGTQIRYEDRNIVNYFSNYTISTANTSDVSPDMFYFNFLGKSGRFFLGSDGNWKVISDEIIDVQTDVSDSANYIYPFINTINLPNSISSNFGYSYISYPKTIKGFTLVDADGMQYTFGGSTNSIEYSTPFLQIHDPEYYQANPTNPAGNDFVTPSMFWCADTWMLTDVTDRFGNSLYSFFYNRGKFIYQLSKNVYSPRSREYEALLKGDYIGMVNAPVYLSWIAINGGEKTLQFASENAFPNEPASKTLYPSFYDNSGNPKWNTSMPSYTPFLFAQSERSNVTPYHAIYPDYTSQSIDPLSTMEIDLLKVIRADNDVSYSLHYDYNSRIHLSTVKMHMDTTSGNSSISNSDILADTLLPSIGKYQLAYYNYPDVPSDYLTECIDYWGYCNSNTSANTNMNRAYQDPGTGGLPGPDFDLGDDDTITNNFIYTWQNRPNSLYGKKGMLSDLTYPTGGSTHFDYEQNTCSRYTIQNGGVFHVKAACDFDAAGLRIKEISNWENGVKLSCLKYNYNSEGRSSGDLYHVPNSCVDRYSTSPLLAADDTILHTERTGSCIIEYDYGASFGGNINSLTPLWDNRGPHMGYETVTVSDSIGNSTTFKYHGCMSQLLIPLQNTGVFVESQHQKGLLVSESYLDNNRDTIKSITYDYGVYGYIAQNAAYNQNGFVFGNVIRPANISTGAYNQYTMYFPIIAISNVTEKEKFNRIWTNTIKTYDYDHFSVHLSEPFAHTAMFNIPCGESVSRGNDVVTTHYDRLKIELQTSNGTSRAQTDPGTSTGGLIPGYNTSNNHDFHAQHFFFPITATTTSLNGSGMKKHVTEYDNHFTGTSLYLPKYEKDYILGSNSPATTIEYTQYEFTNNPRPDRNRRRKGRLKEFVDDAGVKTQLLWDNLGYLVGVAKNCNGTLSTSMNGASQTVTSTIPEEVHGTLPTDISVCNYSKGLITHITNSNNQTTYFNYDQMRHLISVKNQHLEPLLQYQYNYRHK